MGGKYGVSVVLAMLLCSCARLPEESDLELQMFAPPVDEVFEAQRGVIRAILDQNQLESVSVTTSLFEVEDIDGHPRIVELHLTPQKLGGNRLAGISPQIGELTFLRVLNLNGNALTAFPPSIHSLPDLVALFLSDNYIEAIPLFRAGDFPSLQELRLNANRISFVPGEIGVLSTLGTLLLNQNQIEILPPEIMNLANLAVINVEGNRLCQPQPSALVQWLTDLNPGWEMSQVCAE